VSSALSSGFGFAVAAAAAAAAAVVPILVRGKGAFSCLALPLFFSLVPLTASISIFPACWLLVPFLQKKFILVAVADGRCACVCS